MDHHTIYATYVLTGLALSQPPALFHLHTVLLIYAITIKYLEN